MIKQKFTFLGVTINPVPISAHLSPVWRHFEQTSNPGYVQSTHSSKKHHCDPQQSASVVQSSGFMQLGIVGGVAVVPVRNQLVFINIFKTSKMHLVGYLYIHWHISSPH